MNKAIHINELDMSKWRWRNFAPSEIACPSTQKIMLNEQALDALQALRDHMRRPLNINSAYRSPGHNKRVGGSENSKHLQGLAFDISTRGWSGTQKADLLFAARRLGFVGFGVASTYIHIDMRDGQPVMWTY